MAIRAWEAHSDSGRTSTMYLHGRRVVREVWLPRATNIQAAYVDYGPIFVLFSHLFPMWGQQTDRPGHSLLRCHAFLPFFNQETQGSFLSYWFSPFQPRCGFDAYSLGQYSLPSFPYSTQTWISLHEVGFPLIVQIMVSSTWPAEQRIANWEDGGVEKDPHAMTCQMGQ